MNTTTTWSAAFVAVTLLAGITGSAGCLSQSMRERDCFQAYLVNGAAEVQRDVLECWYDNGFDTGMPEGCTDLLADELATWSDECAECSHNNEQCVAGALDCVEACDDDGDCEDQCWVDMGDGCAADWFDADEYLACDDEADQCMAGVEEDDDESYLYSLTVCVDEWEACARGALDDNSYDRWYE